MYIMIFVHCVCVCYIENEQSTLSVYTKPGREIELYEWIIIAPAVGTRNTVRGRIQTTGAVLTQPTCPVCFYRLKKKTMDRISTGPFSLSIQFSFFFHWYSYVGGKKSREPFSEEKKTLAQNTTGHVRTFRTTRIDYVLRYVYRRINAPVLRVIVIVFDLFR